MTEPTDRLKIMESEKSWLEQQRIEYFDRYKQLAGDVWGHNTSIPRWEQDQFLNKLRLSTQSGPTSDHTTPNESISTRFIRDTHISFAHFYLEHSGSEPPLSDEQIYAMWQEKSREK